MGMVDRAALIDLWEDIGQAEEFGHLRTPGISFVPGIGPDQPIALVVGEAPGAQENHLKRPFVGAAGKVLAQLMAAGRLSTDSNAWLTNVIKYRPPLNRTPTADEISDAQPYLRREWELVGRPQLLVAVGATAWRAMSPAGYETEPLSKVAGEPVYRGGNALWPMYHPAYGMRNVSARPKMQQHWDRLGKWLKERLGDEPGTKRARQISAGSTGAKRRK